MPKLPSSLPLPDLRTRQDAFLNAILSMYQRIAGVWNNPDFGSTGARPATGRTTGQVYYDTTLNKPIWWNGTTGTWKDATGANV